MILVINMIMLDIIYSDLSYNRLSELPHFQFQDRVEML